MFDVLGPDDDDKKEEMRRMMLPSLDQGIRSSISVAWMSLPPEKRTIEEVERQVRRLVDRALRDLREDASTFGLPNS
jgi:hypothetical protein